MTTTANTAAAQLLEEWLSDNRLASQYSRYVSTRIRNGDSFYTKLLIEEGEGAAEEALREQDARSRMSDFAASIEPVAQGMLALARIDTEGKHTKVVDVAKYAPFPRCDIYGPSRMVVVLSQPDNSDAFTPYRRLGLKAVTLQAGKGRPDGNTVAQLGLVLPKRGLEPNKEAYIVAAIDLNGFTKAYTYTPSLRDNGYLSYALGLTELDQAIDCSISISSSSIRYFDDAVGFPGATNYLADVLPQLGEYLTARAEKLRSDRKHRRTT